MPSVATRRNGRSKMPDALTSYEDAQRILRAGHQRRLNHNTHLVRHSDGSISVRLHATDVVTYHKDGRISLNTGGWETVITMDRMNVCLPPRHFVSGTVRGDNYRPWVVLMPKGDPIPFVNDRAEIPAP